jgi:hypothetical protein
VNVDVMFRYLNRQKPSAPGFLVLVIFVVQS